MATPQSPPLPAFKSRIIPVVVIEDVAHAVPLAQALLAGGIDVIEITLRSPAALPAIARIAQQVPNMCVGAGTVLTAQQCQAAHETGATFALAPGFSPQLLATARSLSLPFIPGISTAAEALQVLELGYTLAKLFPATLCGGIPLLQTLGSVYPALQLCPTGGLNTANVAAYLKLPNVAFVGGSWLTPTAAMRTHDWDQISAIARTSLRLLQSAD